MAGTERSEAQLPDGPGRKALLAADPVSGQVRAGASVRAALVSSGLAVTSGRIGATYLTPAGLRARRLLAEPEAVRSAEPAQGGFSPAAGDGPAAADAGARAAEVARAWEGLLEVRRVSGDTGVPADWERARPVWAVALALEAAGVPPCAVDDRGHRVSTGYRVLPGSTVLETRVEWRGPASSPARQEAQAQLGLCAERLAQRGWASLLYRASGGLWFLSVTADG